MALAFTRWKLSNSVLQLPTCPESQTTCSFSLPGIELSHGHSQNACSSVSCSAPHVHEVLLLLKLCSMRQTNRIQYLLNPCECQKDGGFRYSYLRIRDNSFFIYIPLLQASKSRYQGDLLGLYPSRKFTELPSNMGPRSPLPRFLT